MDEGFSSWAKAHGFMMWMAWTFLGVFQFVVNRLLMNHDWKWQQRARRVSGIVSLILTVLVIKVTYDALKWKIVFNGPPYT